MNKIMEHVNIIYTTSVNSKNHFINKSQNELVRFVYCGVQKISKIFPTFFDLYPRIEHCEDLEFSLGILSRSILMDMILVMGIKKIYLTYDGTNLDKIKDEIKDYCYKKIADGTKHLIEEINFSDQLTENEKKLNTEKFALFFSKAFNFSGDIPKQKPEFNINLKGLYKEARSSKIITADAIYNLYSYYSKYDHLSHWTSLSQQIPFEKRKEKLDLSIILIAMQLRDLLSIAYDFDEGYKDLLSYITNLDRHLNEKYLDEFVKDE